MHAALNRLLRAGSARICIGIALAAVLIGCGPERYYTLSPLTGVAEVDVVTHMNVTSGKIVRKKPVAAITAFMNARRDHWYDPHGAVFSTLGALELLDDRGKRIASISFGEGGMYQTRPSMTFQDSVKRQEFEVIRDPPRDEGARDAKALCGLLGNAGRTVCDVR